MSCILKEPSKIILIELSSELFFYPTAENILLFKNVCQQRVQQCPPKSSSGSHSVGLAWKRCLNGLCLQAMRRLFQTSITGCVRLIAILPYVLAELVRHN